MLVLWEILFSRSCFKRVEFCHFWTEASSNCLNVYLENKMVKSLDFRVKGHSTHGSLFSSPSCILTAGDVYALYK